MNHCSTAHRRFSGLCGLWVVGGSTFLLSSSPQRNDAAPRFRGTLIQGENWAFCSNYPKLTLYANEYLRRWEGKGKQKKNTEQQPKVANEPVVSQSQPDLNKRRPVNVSVLKDASGKHERNRLAAEERSVLEAKTNNFVSSSLTQLNFHPSHLALTCGGSIH